MDQKNFKGTVVIVGLRKCVRMHTNTVSSCERNMQIIMSKRRRRRKEEYDHYDGGGGGGGGGGGDDDGGGR